MTDINKAKKIDADFSVNEKKRSTALNNRLKITYERKWETAMEFLRDSACNCIENNNKQFD